VPIGAAPVTDPQLWDGPYYPGDSRVDWDKWIAYDVKKRIISGVDPLEFCWLNETFDQRFSTNLLEVLNETIYPDRVANESWTKYDIMTMPDKYTEFKLPVIPSLMGTDYMVYCYGDQKYFKPDVQWPGSYIITTSWMAPNAEGDMNKNQSYDEMNRYAFTFNASYGKGLYINEDPVVEPTPCGWVYHLTEGPSLISFVAIPDNPDTQAIFGSDVDVWGYPWEHYPKAECGKGYYIYATKDKDVEIEGKNCEGITWQTIKNNLVPGELNLVGPGDHSVEIDDTQGIAYIVSDDKVLHQGDTLERGRGYWILATP